MRNKVLSLILAIILVFSAIPCAFATDTPIEDGPLTKAEAEVIAIKYLTFKNQSSIVYDSEYNYLPAYKVISTVVLENNKVVTFVCYVDKDTEDVLYRSGSYVGFNAGPLTQDEALNLAMAAFGVNKADVVVLTKERVYTDDGDLAYHFIFCENVFERNECTVVADTGFIDDISINMPKNFVDRLVLMIRVFITRFNLFNFIIR